MGSNVILAEENGRKFDGYLARPPKGTEPAGKTAGLVILHDMFGINPVFRELADAYAAKGLTVLIPNLFWRDEVPGPLSYDGGHKEAWSRVHAFDFERAGADVGRAADWLRTSESLDGNVAVWGFCFSGPVAILAAARGGFSAAISFYGLGINRWPQALAALPCPAQLHYGLKDEHIPRTEIDAVRAAAQGNPRIEIFLYENAGHSFFNKIRPTYDAAASRMAAGKVERALGIA
jgi:carboxymethylenebutenolidase